MVDGRRGVAPQTAKREQWARLTQRGVSNSEACRIVGINVRTGKRWRHGRTVVTAGGRRLHYAPVITTRKVEIPERYLSQDERVAVADLRRQRYSIRAIAAEIAGAPRRSAGSCAAIGIPSAGSIGRSWRRSLRWIVGPGQVAARS